MKLPRDVGGEELATLLSRYGYQISRQTGSHLRLSSSIKGGAQHLTIPTHKPLKVGTLSAILSDVAGYLETDKRDLVLELFGRQAKESTRFAVVGDRLLLQVLKGAPPANASDCGRGIVQKSGKVACPLSCPLSRFA